MMLGLPGLRSQVGAGFRRLASTLSVSRDDSFAKLLPDDIKHFTSILGQAGVIQDPHDIEPYNRDWMMKYAGACPLVLRPRNTAEVSAVLAHCHERRLAVVPQGGNTGLVGGSVPVFDEVVLSLSRMNTVEGFDEVGGVLTCQAGCILETLDTHLAERGHTMPVDLGAKGSCHIGGNIATNAGGLRLLRYGSLHGRVLGVEVVLADGRVLDALTGLKKDNTGYDLKQLFIGSEGTLGVITRATINCPPRPAATEVAYLACPSFHAAQTVFVRAKAVLGEMLSAFEFLDRESLTVAVDHLPSVKNPLPEAQDDFFLVVEVAGSSAEHVAEALSTFLEGAMEEELISDGVVAQDSTQAGHIWQLREGITEALRHRGAIYKYDLSFPVSEMYDVVVGMRARMEAIFPGACTPSARNPRPLAVVGYGHLGDGNVHLNISAPTYDERIQAAIEPWVYEFTASHRGSVSAEHGLGAMKAGAISYSNTPVAIDVMRAIKQVLDPRGILNPYKVLPPPL